MKPATKVGPGRWRCGDCTGDLVIGNYLICPDDGNRYDIWDGTPVPYPGETEPAWTCRRCQRPVATLEQCPHCPPITVTTDFPTPPPSPEREEKETQ